VPDFRDIFKQIISKNSYQKDMEKEKDRKNRSKREIRGRK